MKLFYVPGNKDYILLTLDVDSSERNEGRMCRYPVILRFIERGDYYECISEDRIKEVLNVELLYEGTKEECVNALHMHHLLEGE